ncbi:MAG: UPF0182 family protein [Anaerolineales bacterium]|nr:UPF0182 family protein [Anaerolineales bacterium]
MSTANRFRLWTIIIIVIALYLVARFGVGLYTDYLWFQHLGLESVMLTGIWARFAVGIGVAIPFAALFWVNTFIARWQSIRNVLFFSDETLVAQRFVVWIIWGVGALLAWIVGMAASSDWLLFLRYLNQHAFDLMDPIFNRDVSFYVFSVPVFRFIQSWLVVSLFLSLIGTVAIYALAQQNNLAEGRIIILPHVQLHFSVIGALIFLTFALDHWLDLFNLVYSERGVAYGASYTDVHVSMPALWVMVVVALATAAILLLNTLIRRPSLSLMAIFVWILAGVIGGGFIPGIIQRYIVEPNELAREAPFIESNIRLTNMAYGLDTIQDRDFTEVEPLTEEAVIANDNFLKNIRLWDYRPLERTYQQIQAIRLYYQFHDIDFDRYEVNNELRQVAISARELNKEALQSRTWVTERLQFTHGYGVVANPVNEVTREGLPQLWIKDLPPESAVNIEVQQPEIYYGETTNDYVFVKTSEREFNYPSGEQNVFTNYEGTGGVALNSFLKRIAFALRLADTNMLLSQEFTNDSRVMFYRNIQQRVNRIAPFLQYDQDPYILVGEDGHLYWLQDAYTTSDRFPYAEPSVFPHDQPRIRINYIRNSVKVLIDAYDGSLTFFVTDTKDPLIQSYQAIFPNLFTPMSEMPDWVRDHIRYPEEIFRIQSELYRTYHMRDVNVFYNKEDLWQIPRENFAGETVFVEPYYVMLKLPGADETEFVLIQPFTPNNKDNLIGWMAARSDGENYGQLVTYRFPKQELIFGPLQIEGRIDQDPEISSQITLWDQGGSQVIRGNLLVLPIDNSLLYVEPLYLQAENGQIPELKRVILASGDKIVMRTTLAEALVALFEGLDEEELPTTATSATPGGETVSNEAVPSDDSSPSSTSGQADLADKGIAELAQMASDHYEAARQALRQGDWTTYGRELDQMEAVLNTLVQLTSQQQP